jgi:hypothetical protein
VDATVSEIPRPARWGRIRDFHGSFRKNRKHNASMEPDSSFMENASNKAENTSARVGNLLRPIARENAAMCEMAQQSTSVAQEKDPAAEPIHPRFPPYDRPSSRGSRGRRAAHQEKYKSMKCLDQIHRKHQPKAKESDFQSQPTAPMCTWVSCLFLFR